MADSKCRRRSHRLQPTGRRPDGGPTEVQARLAFAAGPDAVGGGEAAHDFDSGAQGGGGGDAGRGAKLWAEAPDPAAGGGGGRVEYERHERRASRQQVQSLQLAPCRGLQPHRN
jgi:hypothetical protein